jgi:D-alanyl-D-alanine dipeptidase
MVDYTWQRLAEQRGWHLLSLSPEQWQELERLVSTFWANPSSDPQTPPPHSTGSAIDVTLITRQGIAVDMGSPIDEVSERSHPDYFQQTNPTVHRHRQILYEAMTAAGWARHPQEWWHFSYGDQRWAWVTGCTHARYGRVPE